MATAETKKTEEAKPFVPVCPFHIRKPVPYKEPGPLVKVNRITDQVTVDKETMVVSPVIEQYDIQAEIQTYKDQCGLEYFQQLVLQGKAHPEDSHDDGSHGVDMSMVPGSIHEAKAASDALSEEVAKVAKSVGAKDGKAYTSDELIELLSESIAAKLSNPESNPQPNPQPKE